MHSHVVRQGGRERLDILVARSGGFEGPIAIAARKLPPGVTADPIVIGPGMKWGTLVASEPLDDDDGEWQPVPNGGALSFERQVSLQDAAACI